jgi:uncharacterized phiE125 gp8 family phage protein
MSYNSSYGYRNRHQPAYNAVLDHLFTEIDTVEPVTLTDVKQHLNMVFDTAGSEEFTDDDSYLTKLITRVRALIEKATGLSLVGKTVQAMLRNEKGDIELPFGPVRDDSTYLVVDNEEVTLDESDYKLVGLQFKKLKYPRYDEIYVTYQVGYTADNIPHDLKQAILEEIAFRYENRGAGLDDAPSLSKSVQVLIENHARGGWLI